MCEADWHCLTPARSGTDIKKSLKKKVKEKKAEPLFFYVQDPKLFGEECGAWCVECRRVVVVVTKEIEGKHFPLFPSLPRCSIFMRRGRAEIERMYTINSKWMIFSGCSECPLPPRTTMTTTTTATMGGVYLLGRLFTNI